jgi:hypothetical protein
MSAQDSNSTAAGGWLVFDYLYRDASNYKAFGSVRLTGILTEAERTELVECLDGSEFFVAEQIGVPPLYPALFEEGGGPTEDDHAWHMFEGFREEREMAEEAVVWGEASALLAAFRAAKGKWRLELSPNFDW